MTMEQQIDHEEQARREAARMADGMGIDRSCALAVFDILGPDELGDGFAIALEDMADMEGFAA